MQFDYTFINFYGFIFFEPLITVSNFIMLICALYYFRELKKFKFHFSRQFALFILFTGITGIFGSLAHSVHFQWGDRFFNGALFMMNLSSLMSMLYCFFGVYSYITHEKGRANQVAIFAWLWMGILISYTYVYNEFVVVKVHVGMVSVFTLFVFSLTKLKSDPGSRHIVSGMLIALLAVAVHTMQIRLHEWFNHKDMAHLFMLFSLYQFFRGVELNSRYVFERSVVLSDI